MSIRNAKSEDLSKISEIHISGWRFAYKGILADEYLYNQDFSNDAYILYNRILESPHPKLEIFDDGTIKGFIVHNTRDHKTEHYYEISSLYVEPEFLRQGIGSSLLRNAETYARTCGENIIKIWCMEKNEIGLDFYYRHGYIFDGEKIKDDRLQTAVMRLKKDCR